MAKKLSSMDVWEESIRQNAVSYNIVLFAPGRSTRIAGTEDSLDAAKTFSYTIFEKLSNVRAALIYAIDSQEHHALVGTIDSQRVWKPVVVK